MKNYEKLAIDTTAIAKTFAKTDMPLISTLVKASNLIPSFTVVPNVKGAADIKIVDAIATLQPSSCTFSPSGSAILSEKKLITTGITVQDTFCLSDLRKTAFELTLAAGSSNEKLDENNAVFLSIIENLIAKIAVAQDNLMLLGDTASGNSQLAFFDGVFKKINTSLTATNVTFPQINALSQDPTDPTQALGIVNTFAEAIPTEIFDKGFGVEIWVSQKVYRALKTNIFNLNNFGFQIVEDRKNLSYPSFELPISGIRVKALPQLLGLDTSIYGVVKELMFMGVDLEQDYQALNVVADPLTRSLNTIADFTAGVEIALDNNFVKATFL